MDDISLARTLWQANADWARKIVAHPFVQGLGDGSLATGFSRSRRTRSPAARRT